MFIGLEAVVSVIAVGSGIAIFVLALRRRPDHGAILNSDTGTAGILKINLLSLVIIGLVFFGSAGLVDVFS